MPKYLKNLTKQNPSKFKNLTQILDMSDELRKDLEGSFSQERLHRDKWNLRDRELFQKIRWVRYTLGNKNLIHEVARGSQGRDSFDQTIQFVDQQSRYRYSLIDLVGLQL